jgi:hypothetical protein
MPTNTNALDITNWSFYSERDVLKALASTATIVHQIGHSNSERSTGFFAPMSHLISMPSSE